MRKSKINVRAFALLLAPLLLIGEHAASAPSAADCVARAQHAERNAGTLLGGAARGTVGGAVVGTIIGGRKGRRRGAALGALGGGARRARKKRKKYNSVYKKCMSGG